MVAVCETTTPKIVNAPARSGAAHQGDAAGGAGVTGISISACCPEYPPAMSDPFPPPNPSTRRTVTGRPAWKPWHWILFAVVLLVGYMILSRLLGLPGS